MVPGRKSIDETHTITDRNTDSNTDTDMYRDTDDSDRSNTSVKKCLTVLYMNHIL